MIKEIVFLKVIKKVLEEERVFSPSGYSEMLEEKQYEIGAMVETRINEIEENEIEEIINQEIDHGEERLLEEVIPQ